MSSRNIARLTSIEGFNLIRATCGCMSEDHTQDILFNVEREDEFVHASIEVNLEHITDNFDDNFITLCWKRIKAACEILFTGRLQMSHNFYFEDAEQVKDYTDAILEAYAASKEYRDKIK